MSWISSYYIYVLIVTAPGGLTSQLGVYPSLDACQLALIQHEIPGEFVAECRQRVRAVYQ